MFSQSSNFEKVINLVKINTKKVIAIEFDNIKIESVKLDGIQSSWQKVTDISQLLLEKSDNEILSFEINDRYYPNQKN
ncbi:9672_t:CDS:1, partial [Rhizophagus irregularis]